MKTNAEPLGGVEVPGFGPWIRDKAAEVARTAQILREKHPEDSPARMLGNESHKDFASVLHRWRLLTEAGVSPDGGDNPRAQFENYLVDLVVTSAAFLDDARQGRASGRSTVLIDAEHGRACLFMGRYLGIDPERIRKCGSDRTSVVATAGVR
jgi:hypothetical protein